MKHRILFAVLLIVCLAALAGCSCEHTWVEADCVNPKTCSECQETEGSALGHDWTDATCQAAKTCTRCGETEGNPLAHHWADATCQAAKTCNDCGTVEGEPLGHTSGEWKETTDPVSCSISREQYCSVCDELLKSETSLASSLIQDGLFLFTPNQFIERLTLVANQHSDKFTYNFFDGTGLQIVAYSNGKQSIIQFFRKDATALAASEQDVAEVWCVSLIQVDEADSNFRLYFLMACDPTLDEDTAFDTDTQISVAYLNAAAYGNPLGYYRQNGLLYESSFIDKDTLGQAYSMTMTNAYASNIG